MSKGEREITSKLNHFYRGEILRGREFFYKETEVSLQKTPDVGY